MKMNAEPIRQHAVAIDPTRRHVFRDSISADMKPGWGPLCFGRGDTDDCGGHTGRIDRFFAEAAIPNRLSL